MKDDAAKRAKELGHGNTLWEAEIAAAIREAAEAQRERDARIADAHDVLPRTAPDFTHQQGRAEAAADIAAAIRAGAPVQSATTWTREAPMVTGHYWYRIGPSDAAEVVYLVRSPSGIWYANGNSLNEYWGEWWPVPVPEPPA